MCVAESSITNPPVPSIFVTFVREVAIAFGYVGRTTQEATDQDRVQSAVMAKSRGPEMFRMSDDFFQKLLMRCFDLAFHRSVYQGGPESVRKVSIDGQVDATIPHTGPYVYDAVEPVNSLPVL